MIYGDRIRLRMVEKEDLVSFVSWFNDPEVREGLSMYTPISLGFEEQWYQKNIARPLNEQVLVVEAKKADNWKMIGTAGFHGIDWVSRTSEVGISIGDKTEWDKGYGTEVMKMLLKYGFNSLNLHRISLKVFATNLRAMHVYKKVGFIQEGVERESLYKDGKYIDVYLMSVLKSEWIDQNA